MAVFSEYDISAVDKGERKFDSDEDFCAGVNDMSVGNIVEVGAKRDVVLLIGKAVEDKVERSTIRNY